MMVSEEEIRAESKLLTHSFDPVRYSGEKMMRGEF